MGIGYISHVHVDVKYHIDFNVDNIGISVSNITIDKDFLTRGGKR